MRKGFSEKSWRTKEFISAGSVRLKLGWYCSAEIVTLDVPDYVVCWPLGCWESYSLSPTRFFVCRVSIPSDRAGWNGEPPPPKEIEKKDLSINTLQVVSCKLPVLYVSPWQHYRPKLDLHYLKSCRILGPQHRGSFIRQWWYRPRGVKEPIHPILIPCSFWISACYRPYGKSWAVRKGLLGNGRKGTSCRVKELSFSWHRNVGRVWWREICEQSSRSKTERPFDFDTTSGKVSAPKRVITKPYRRLVIGRHTCAPASHTKNQPDSHVGPAGGREW